MDFIEEVRAFSSGNWDVSAVVNTVLDRMQNKQICDGVI